MKRIQLTIIPAVLFFFAAYTLNTEAYDHHRNADPNIVELAAATEDLSTLATAVIAAELDEMLANGGPFTVFAPTNEAFAALPDGTLEMLLMPENREMLQSVLALHVIPAKVKSTELSDGMTAETANGGDLTFSISYSGAQVNGADIIMTDIMASNGVVHVIDSVILPEAEPTRSYGSRSY